MKCGLYAACDQLASRSATATSSQAGRKLDSVMEFGRELVCDLLASKIAYGIWPEPVCDHVRFELAYVDMSRYLEPVCNKSETRSATRKA